MPSFSQILAQSITDAGVGGQATASYANFAAFPSSGNTVGDLAIALDTKALYMWDGSEWDRIKVGVEQGPVFTAEPEASYLVYKGSDPFTINATAVDPEGFDVSYDYGTSPSNQTSATVTNNNDGTFTVTPSLTDGGSFSLRLLANDGVNISTITSVIEVSLSNAVYLLDGSLSVLQSGITPPTILSYNLTTVDTNKSQINTAGDYLSIQDIPNMTFSRQTGKYFPVFAVRFNASVAAAIGIVMRNSDNTYQYGIGQNSAQWGFFPDGAGAIQYFSSALALNTWYIFTPYAHWSSGDIDVWRVKQVGGNYLTLNASTSSAGFSAPTTTLAGSMTFFGGNPNLPLAVQGYLSRAAMPHTFGGMALYPVDTVSADDALAEVESILFS
jgi:hypothetical protein